MASRSDKIPYLPENLHGLADIALNLSWRWNRDARELFREIDPTLWHLSGRNPVELLRRVDPARLAACTRDPGFMELYRHAMEGTERDSTNAGTWFATEHPDCADRLVAYFCAEFGVHNSVPIYSGGLGVLAGDHCKSASDLGIPFVGVGLLYLRGYFDQHLTSEGWQVDNEEQFDPNLTPLEPLLSADGGRSLATITLYGRAVRIGAWRMSVGRAAIYLLDANLEENEVEDRELTQRLYQGGDENRLCQEWILGVGGVRVLRALDLHPDVWHANEGHAAFMMVERVRELVSSGTPLDEARAIVRGTSVFTTHTPVPAGHDRFGPEQVDRTLGHYWNSGGIDRETFLGFGHHPSLDHMTFHMTAAAMRLSRFVNGVAQNHGQVTRENWKDLWPGRDSDDVPITHITNGVHVTSWMAFRMMSALDEHLGTDWALRMGDREFWKGVLTLDDHVLCLVRKELKGYLLNFVREQARQRWRTERWEAEHLVGAGTLLDPSALTIAFARRFATYKRAQLLFHDVDRLKKLLTNPWRPVQLIFAGKAHPSDDLGKEMLHAVYSFTRDPQFEGRIAFVEDYDLNVADRLVQGVDLWINLPQIPMEACGTSGMKAGLNAIPQLSTLDGWWAEGYTGLNGWALPVRSDADDPDAADAESLFHLLETEVVPLFYDRDEEGLHRGWLERMKHALFEAGAFFTGSRMVREYAETFYLPAMRGTAGEDIPPS